MKWVLAQYNVVQLAYPIDSPELKGFHALLDPIHTAGDEAKGFIWRFKGDGANDALDVRPPDGNPRILVAMTVWDNPDALADFMKGPHLEAFLRRREWFVKGSGQNVCWWIRNYTLPTIEEGERRLDELRRLGPSRTAFTLRNRFDAPE